MRLVGVTHPIQDAQGKAAGRTRYAADLELPRMAHVAMVFSDRPLTAMSPLWTTAPPWRWRAYTAYFTASTPRNTASTATAVSILKI